MSQPNSPFNIPPFNISPPLLNSSNPWASDEQQLRKLYACPHTGAVTIRTSLLNGFPQDPKIHQHTFFSPQTGHSTIPALTPKPSDEEEKELAAASKYKRDTETSSLNTYGYSPHPFSQYLSWLRGFRDSGFLKEREDFLEHVNEKPFIISVTGSPPEIGTCLELLLDLQNEAPTLSSRNHGKGGLRVIMEINLSCPNIPSKPPPAYNKDSLLEYLEAVEGAKCNFLSERMDEDGECEGVHVGIKIPPYTYHAQFLDLLGVPGFGETIDFITAVNTLGGCLVLDDQNQNSLGSANGLGIGGMAGDALHPLALGNVRTLRSLLDASDRLDLRGIKIIGIGGVKDAAGFERMRSVGADAVGVGTEYGRSGLKAFCTFAEVAEGTWSTCCPGPSLRIPCH